MSAASPIGMIKAITGVSTSTNHQKNGFIIPDLDKQPQTTTQIIKTSLNIATKQGFEKIEEEELFDRDYPRRMRMQQKTTVG